MEITLDLEALRPNKKTGRCKAHHVSGKIRYPETPATELGEILYIKSSLTGTIKREKDELPCEPIDISNYRFEHSTFPHDTPRISGLRNRNSRVTGAWVNTWSRRSL